MDKWVDRILDRVCVVVVALIFLQAPLFIQQYQEQLIGHVQELDLQVHAIAQAAQESGKSLDQFINKFTQNQDQDFAKQGLIMKQMIIRKDKLSNSLKKLKESSILSKPWIFLIYMDWEIFHSTSASFKWGLTFSYEALVYGLLGIFAGYFLYLALSAIISFCARMIQKNKRSIS